MSVRATATIQLIDGHYLTVEGDLAEVVKELAEVLGLQLTPNIGGLTVRWPHTTVSAGGVTPKKED